MVPCAQTQDSLPLMAPVSLGGILSLTLNPTTLPHVTFSPSFHTILAFSSPCSQPLLNSPPSFVCWSRGFMEMDRQGELVESLKRFCASTRLPPTPLLLFPEEEATNGRVGLLRFRWVSAGIWLQLGRWSSLWALGFLEPFQPLCHFTSNSFPFCPLLVLSQVS